MADSVKKQILGRIEDLCNPLIADGVFRTIDRVRGYQIGAAIRPALQIIAGDEIVVGEDDRGYICRFPLDFKALFSEERNAYSLQDDFEAFIQTTIEADPQLNGIDASALATKVTFDGVLEMTNELIKPSGGCSVLYTVEFRRYRAHPDLRY